jgi:hypothetical protein
MHAYNRGLLDGGGALARRRPKANPRRPAEDPPSCTVEAFVACIHLAVSPGGSANVVRWTSMLHLPITGQLL